MPGGLADLVALAPIGKLAGVRPMLQGLDDISFMLEHNSLAQLEQIAKIGLVFDALIEPRQLGTIDRICRLVPSLKVVVDHMAKPWRAPDRLDDWASGMRALAWHTNCAIKVSGFPFASVPAAAGEAIEDLVAFLRETFGPQRLLWGSDWPVAEREGGYHMVTSRMRAQFDEIEREAVFGGNTAGIYGLHTDKTSPTR
jgi:L-fuconolactonase